MAPISDPSLRGLYTALDRDLCAELFTVALPELAEELEESSLLASRDELLERCRDRRLLGRGPAERQGALDEVRVEVEVGRHV